mgnify:FL=1
MYVNKNKKNIIKKDLVLLGAGHSNIEVLKKFGTKPIDGLRLTLISNSYFSTYSGMIPGYLQGIYDWNEINIDLVKLCRVYGHRLIMSNIIKIDTKNNSVFLENRPSINYDFLSINLGIKTDSSKIKGAEKNCLRLKPISSIKENFDKLLKFNKVHKNNDIVIIGAGAAGFEVALALDENLKRKNIKNNIILLSKNSSVLNQFNKTAELIAKKNLEKCNIKFLNYAEVVIVTSNYVLLKDGRKIFCKLPILATNSGPLDLLKKSDLPLTKNGSILVESNLLVSGYNNIFSSGDISEIKGYSIPKAGVFAVRQGKILAKNIKKLYLQKKLSQYRPQKYFLSIIGLQNNRALAIKSIFSIKGQLIWSIKKYIDKKFIEKYTLYKRDNYPEKDQIEPVLNQMQCKGCASKIPQSILDSVFEENTKKGSLDADKVPNTKNIFQTTDIISSIVSDPFELGIISAKHALNDILASNTKPLAAQMIVSLPPAINEINKRDLIQVKSGADYAMKKATCKIIGGHSYSNNDDQVYLGFSIIGKKKNYVKSKKIKKGKLYITGKIGSALVFAAIEKKIISGMYSEEVINNMKQSNYDIFKIFSKYSIQHITDISGFGLAIHANNLLLRNSDLNGLEISLKKVPLYKGAIEALNNNVKSSLNDANKNSIINNLRVDYDKINKNYLNCLFDPQTAGGFLFILDPTQKKILNELDKKKINYSSIGRVINSKKKIKVI